MGKSGIILFSTDTGDTWTTQISVTTTVLNGVYFLDINYGCTDGGNNWNIKLSGTSARFQRLIFSDTNNGTAVGTTYHTYNRWR